MKVISGILGGKSSVARDWRPLQELPVWTSADRQVHLQDSWVPLTSQTNVFPGPNKPGSIMKLWKDKPFPFYPALMANVGLWEENTCPNVDAWVGKFPAEGTGGKDLSLSPISGPEGRRWSWAERYLCRTPPNWVPSLIDALCGTYSRVNVTHKAN